MFEIDPQSATDHPFAFNSTGFVDRDSEEDLLVIHIPKMSSPPHSTSFSFKMPQSRNSLYDNNPDLIIPGGDFEDMGYSPAHRPATTGGGMMEGIPQPIFRPLNDSSRSRDENSSSSNESGIHGRMDGPQLNPFASMSISVGSAEHQSTYQHHQPPESHSYGESKIHFAHMNPTTPVLIPTRGFHGNDQFSSGSMRSTYDRPPPLTSSSTAFTTHAMTPSTGRNYAFPRGTSSIKSSFDGSPQSYQQLSNSQYIYNTPTPASRRPLMTTASSAPNSFRPIRQLPNSLGQSSHYMLPAPSNMELSSPIRSGRGSVFVKDEMTGQMYLQKCLPKPPKEHRCLTCNKNFARPSALQTHQAVHTGAKPHQCPHLSCGKRFSVMSNMRRHRRTHDRDELFHARNRMGGYVSPEDYELMEEEALRGVEEIYSSEGERSPFRSQFGLSSYISSSPLQMPGNRRLARVNPYPRTLDSAKLGNAAPTPHLGHFQTPYHMGTGGLEFGMGSMSAPR